jgi:ATP phosphoribosyltransferase
VRRLQGVLVARTYVMMDYDIPNDRVEAASAVTPGIESPTVSPLHREGWSPCARWCAVTMRRR